MSQATEYVFVFHWLFHRGDPTKRWFVQMFFFHYFVSRAPENRCWGHMGILLSFGNGNFQDMFVSFRAEYF